MVVLFKSAIISLRIEYKYLGAIFQSDSLYHSHIKQVFDQCQ